MAKIFPFRGVVYNKKKLKNLAQVICPPYDVIPKKMQEELYDVSDFNMVRLILGKDFPGDSEYNNKYVRSAASFEGWLRHEVLLRDDKPAIYIYEQKFIYNRKAYTRVGMIALLRLEDLGKGKVFPHEHTLSKPKLDRIELIRATSTNLDCIFSLFSDEKEKVYKIFKKLMRKKPDFDIKHKDLGINRLWRVTQKSAIAKIQKEFKDKAVFIADGHHRYEAALRFKSEMKLRNTRFTEEESYNHVMMYFTAIENPGLLVLPIHRLVKHLPQSDIEHLLVELGAYFNITEVPFGKRTEMRARKKLSALLLKNKAQHSFGLYFKDQPHKYYLVSLKDEGVMQDLIEEDKPLAWKKLDVTILHSLVFEDILGVNHEDNFTFSKDENEVFDKVKSGEYALGVLLNPTSVEEIITIAGKYERMPQKSTYFYPKLTTGMVMNRINFVDRVE